MPVTESTIELSMKGTEVKFLFCMIGKFSELEKEMHKRTVSLRNPSLDVNVPILLFDF